MKISLLVAKKMLKKNKINATICKVKETKACLIAVFCASKVNMSTCERGSIRKEKDGI